jgi:hypothetical protein
MKLWPWYPTKRKKLFKPLSLTLRWFRKRILDDERADFWGLTTTP